MIRRPASPPGSLAGLGPWLIASVFFCLVILWPIYRPAGHGLDVIGYPIGRDFINVWAGPRIAWSHRVPVLFDLQGYARAISQTFGRNIPPHNWGYPPFTLIAFAPFAALPYFVALGLWTALLFCAFAAAGAALVERSQRPVVWLALACSPASIVNAVGGQNGFLSAALLIGGVLLIERRPLVAGVLIGLLTFKPQLGLVLPLALVALSAWRTIAAAIVTALVLVAMSVCAFGLDPWRHYLTETSAYQLSLLKSFHGFFPYMMTSVLAEARTLGASFPVAAVLQALVSLPTLVIAAWAARRATTPSQRAFVLVSAAPLITPYAFNYDLTALSAVILWRLIAAPPAQGPRRALLLSAWLIPVFLMPLNMAHLAIAPVFLIAVFALAVVEAGAGAGAQAPEPSFAAAARRVRASPRQPAA